MTDDQRTRLQNAAGNIQHDGLTLQIAAKRGDSIDELRRLFDALQDSWECLAEVWREIDGAPGLNKPLTLSWLREHVSGKWIERNSDTWSLRKNDVAIDFRYRLFFSVDHNKRRFLTDGRWDRPVTIHEAVTLLRLAGVPLKGVE